MLFSVDNAVITNSRVEIISVIFARNKAHSNNSLGARRRLVEEFGVKNPEKAIGWSISHDDALVIIEEISRFMQRNMVSYLEFGFGLSTRIVFQYLSRSFRQFDLLSIEGDKEYYHKARDWLSSANVTEKKRLAVTHVPYNEGTGLFDSNLVDIALEGLCPDVVFVDAPPDTNGADVRYKTIMSILPFLHRKSIVILHDTKRVDERYAVEQIASFFMSRQDFETPKGISVLRFPSADK